MRHQAYGTVGKLLVGLVLVMPAMPSVSEAQTTMRVSVGLDVGGDPNGSSGPLYWTDAPNILSADGRFVAFASDASNLVPGDGNGHKDIFVYDRQTGTTNRVSVNTQGGDPDNSSLHPALSADGRFVAFASEASNLVPGDGNRRYDIFVHDRQTGTTSRVSVNTQGGDPNSSSLKPSLSADGRFVAFASSANNLVAGDGNRHQDIFVHDRQTGTTSRVSVNTQGGDPNGFSSNLPGGRSGPPAISADGRFVAFDSEASNLVVGDRNGHLDIFVHDRQTGTTSRVSVNMQGGDPDQSSLSPALSANGRFVAFRSWASNLVAGDRNGQSDIFVHDRQTGTTSRVSVNMQGGDPDEFSYHPALSADGRFVAFETAASNLVVGTMSRFFRDIFVYDRHTRITTRVSVNTQGGDPDQLSFSPALSADGRFVAFGSAASNLVIGDGNGQQDVFVHGRGSAPSHDPNRPDVNGDGRADLVWCNTSNGATMVWLMAATGLRQSITFPGGMPTNWEIRAVADANGDGRADLVWRNTSNGGTMVWLMAATGLRQSITFPGGMPTNWEIRAVADANGDGRADLVWRNTSNGGTMVWLMAATGLRQSITFPGGMPLHWEIQKVADVNGDGRADLVWRNTSNGGTMVWLMAATGLRQSITFPGGMPLHWALRDVADVNGDGRADLVWRNTSNGGTMVWSMTATGLRQAITFPGGIPLHWALRDVADVNGDGRADVVWRNTSNGGTMVWSMTATGFRQAITFPGGMPLHWEIKETNMPIVPNVSNSVVTIIKTGSGTGTVISIPSGINCGPSCSGSFTNGTFITLTAMPASGAIFVGWSGGDCMGTATCSFSLTDNTMVTATFNRSPSDIPSITGLYTGTSMATNTNCSDSDLNTTFTLSAQVNILTQNGNAFTAQITGELVFDGDVFSGTDQLTGMVSPTGDITGTIVGQFGGTTSVGTFSGHVRDSTLFYSFTNQDTSGETCHTNGTVMATK